jgi:8-oxo-dGTP diphosphatase
VDQIKVGVGVVILQHNKVLLGQRKSPHGHSHWSFPGGHVEFGESPEEAAVRETFEETGLVIDGMQKIHFTSDIFEDGRHYITLYIIAKECSGVVRNMEPEKCEGWQWFSPASLPFPLFKPVATLLREIDLVRFLET